MSRETTEARFTARAAEQDWREHRRDCPMCSAASQKCLWSALCKTGTKVRADHLEATRELARQLALDKLPSPDQELLW